VSAAIESMARALDLSAKVNMGVAQITRACSPQEQAEALSDVCHALADLVEASPEMAAEFLRGAAAGVASAAAKRRDVSP